MLRAAISLALFAACGAPSAPPAEPANAPVAASVYAPWPVLSLAEYPETPADESFPSSPPRELAAIAAQLEGGENERAALALQDLVESSHDPQAISLGRYWLARALYRLGYTQSAFSELDVLSQSIGGTSRALRSDINGR